MALGTSAKEAVRQIVGIVLVRNEDRFVRQSVTNILGFCDRILLVDNGSRDQTPIILKELAASNPVKISFHAIRNPRESHDLLKPYIGTPTWIFAVDEMKYTIRRGLVYSAHDCSRENMIATG